MKELYNLDTHVIAHRGASAYAPENTMIAFSKAAQLGAKWVEFDVKLAGDGTAIVFHDDCLDRTTNAKGWVSDYPYSYLRTLDAGAWFKPIYAGERIPTFHQVLEFIVAAGLRANIEIKANPGEEEQTVKAVLSETKKWFAPPYQPVLFSSFSLRSLQLLRQQSPDCAIGFLMEEWVADWQRICADLGAVTVNIDQDILNSERAHSIKRTEIGLLCYTVNNPEKAQELYKWGVDAVFSDCFDRVLKRY